eukprot:8105508-Lingulodinium_polyedra.AAC.1
MRPSRDRSVWLSLLHVANQIATRTKSMCPVARASNDSGSQINGGGMSFHAKARDAQGLYPCPRRPAEPGPLAAEQKILGERLVAMLDDGAIFSIADDYVPAGGRKVLFGPKFR